MRSTGSPVTNCPSHTVTVSISPLSTGVANQYSEERGDISVGLDDTYFFPLGYNGRSAGADCLRALRTLSYYRECPNCAVLASPACRSQPASHPWLYDGGAGHGSISSSISQAFPLHIRLLLLLSFFLPCCPRSSL